MSSVLTLLSLLLLVHGPMIQADAATFRDSYFSNPPPPAPSPRNDGGGRYAADWPMWGYDLSNHRYNPAETTLNPANVNTLVERWTFAFPDTMFGAGQPTVIGDTVYVGSWNGTVYALDVTTGKPRWSFSTNVTGKTASIRQSPLIVHNLVIFGDQMGRVFALNQNNGSLAWLQQSISDHPAAQITGSLIAYGDRLYVPMASREESAAIDITYPCCTFRGSLTALNIADGSIAWQFHTVEAATFTRNNRTGQPNYGPSGVGIWTTPAIDPDAGIIYITTGNNYSQPTTPYSDAILAINLKDGSLRWAQQLTGDDWSTTACTDRATAPNPNCEDNVPDQQHGRDVDFGSSPLLFTVQTASGPRKLLAAEQKNGILHTLDALTGEVVWEQQVGDSGTSQPWGTSYDGRRLYVSDNSVDQNGGVYALNPATGAVLWHTGSMPCAPIRRQLAQDCWSGFMTTATSTPGLLWIGSMDGQVRALDSATGAVLWTYNTAQAVWGVNGVAGQGGSIGPAGAVVANGQVYVVSGYLDWNSRMVNGNVLDVFGLPEWLRF